MSQYLAMQDGSRMILADATGLWGFLGGLVVVIGGAFGILWRRKIDLRNVDAKISADADARALETKKVDDAHELEVMAFKARREHAEANIAANLEQVNKLWLHIDRLEKSSNETNRTMALQNQTIANLQARLVESDNEKGRLAKLCDDQAEQLENLNTVVVELRLHIVRLEQQINDPKQESPPSSRATSPATQSPFRGRRTASLSRCF
jgi:chromosome segregation ATPase